MKHFTRNMFLKLDDKHKYPHTGMVSTKFYREIGFAGVEKYVTIIRKKYQTFIAEDGKRRNGKNKENQKKRRQCG